MIRAHIEQDYASGGLAVFITRQINNTTQLAAQGQFGRIDWTDLDDDGAYNSDRQPTYRIPREIATELLDALAAHHGGTTDSRTTRADFLHERGRVDKMLAHLMGETR